MLLYLIIYYYVKMYFLLLPFPFYIGMDHTKLESQIPKISSDKQEQEYDVLSLQSDYLKAINSMSVYIEFFSQKNK